MVCTYGFLYTVIPSSLTLLFETYNLYHIIYNFLFVCRYDTPTRPRTSSYSSRSNASASQVTSLQSPGTPGSVTPRGTGSRSRTARFADYYDQTLDYADRHFRSYDEYSQSSTASHEDLYEHEYGFVHDAGDPLQGTYWELTILCLFTKIF